ncbi:hypothetical protein [Cyclobacterium jeungdonense]|uniref:Uncharacterized protein n=1 Tax=Cyclobacterium jeungdonense TaxID=708087 RepID=A0ABT8C395_9BACT|nr:hypothetical protein [Cyclobacterium jeungdonense]MDN3687248.1 hypothetical protein [Cyclobacterium jeungdonense]
MQPKLKNVTPMELTVRLSYGTISNALKIDLKPFNTEVLDLPDGLLQSNESKVTAHIYNKLPQFEIGLIKFHPARPLVIIDSNCLHSYRFQEKDLLFYPVDLLSLYDIRNSFTTTFRKDTPFGIWLFNQLSPQVQSNLGKDGSGFAGPNSSTNKQHFLDDLNRLLHGPLLFDHERFSKSNIRLREDTKLALSRKPEGINLVLLNRMLLEDTYPSGFKKFSPFHPSRELKVVNNTPNFVQLYRDRQNEHVTTIPGFRTQNTFSEVSRVGETYRAETRKYGEKKFTVSGINNEALFTIEPTTSQDESPAFDIAMPIALSLQVSFVNKARRYVILYRKGAQGNEIPVTAPLAPNEVYSVVSLVGELYTVRGSFTGELLSVFLINSDINSPLVIDANFKEERGKEFPLPSPVPEIPTLTVIASDREKPNPRAKNYILISVKENHARRQFNTLKNLPTRTIKISGVELIWDLLNNESGLMNYQGEHVTDIESLEIFADRVVISSPLRFPGTEVRIFARELKFEGEGKIDTTPMAYKAQASSQYKTKEGKPADKNNNPTYRAADGLHGESGGDIHLYVKHIKLPDEKKRLITRGTQGQQAEAGGLQAYRQGSPDQPATDQAKNLTTTVTSPLILEHFKKIQYYDVQKNYRWPGEVRHPNEIQEKGKQLFPDEGGNITYLKLVTFIEKPFLWNEQVLWLPDGETHNRLGPHSPIGKELETVEKGPSTPRRPGDGEDAYPGGQPGDGGQGGKIHSTFDPERLLDISDCAGGEAGLPTQPVKGGTKGSPVPAYSVEMVIVNYDDAIAADRKPYLRLTNVTAKDGKDAPEKLAAPGLAGEIVTRENTYGWMHPNTFDAVLACAKDAYRNGHREFAAALLDPYYAELKHVSSQLDKQHPERLTSKEKIRIAELANRLPVLEGLRIRLLNNLDYYGNPPGWLPRLKVLSNFEIFQSVRKISSKLLYYSLNMNDKYETLENRGELALQTQKVLEEEIKISEGRLKDAFTELAIAIQDLEKVSEFVKEKSTEIEYLKNWALQDAQQRVQEQRIFRGVMKLIGGLMSAIPVGQPYLGLAGGITSQIGDFSWTKPNEIPDQIIGTINGISATTSSFLKDNKDLIIADRVKGLQKDLKTQEGDKETLEERIQKAKGSITIKEEEIQKIKDTWKASNKEEIDENKKNLEELKEYLSKEKDFFMLSDAEKAKQAADLQRLKDWSEQGDIKAIVAYQNGLAKTIEVLEKNANEEKTGELQKKFDALKKHRTTVESLDKSVKAVTAKQEATEQEKQRKETEMGKTVDRLQRIAEGIPKITQAVAGLMTPTTVGDPEVVDLAKSILTSEKKEDYEKLIHEFQLESAKQKAALTRLESVQHTISTNVAGITESLTQLNGLSQTRQSMDASLDVRVKRYLKDMQERARDGLRWAIYNFVMAYRYEKLSDVNDTLYNLDTMVTALRKVKGDDKNIWELDYEKFHEVENVVMNNEFLKLFQQCINELQHKGKAKKNSLVFRFNETQCESLRRNGTITFNLVRDFDVFSWKYREARIMDLDVTDKNIDLDLPKGSNGLIIHFKHSGSSVILKDEQYYWFDSGTDEPISWGFTYNPSEDNKVTKDEKGDDSELLNNFLKAAGGTTKIDYLEYYPSLFGDITISINSSDKQWQPERITKINNLSFTVTYLSTGVK